VGLIELFTTDRAQTTVTSGGTDAPVSGTVETWVVASSAMFGVPVANVSQFHVSDPFAPSEIIVVTNVTGTTWTVTRGSGPTTPVPHAAGFMVFQVATAGFLAGVASVKQAPLNPLTFGAAGNGTTLDDTAMQAMFGALATAGNGHAYFPPGYTFRTSQPLVIPTGARIEGCGAGAISIHNTASDVFQCVSGNLYNVHVHDLGVWSGTGGGHIFNLTAGLLACSQLNHLYLRQDNAAESALLTAAFLDSSLTSSFLYGAVNRSAPLIYGVSTAGVLSDNRFRDLRITDQGSPTTWALWWEEKSTSRAVGNVFEEINFENPVGGAMTVRGQYNYKISGIYLWDLSAQATNDLVAPRASTGGQSNYYGLIEQVSFQSGTPTGGGFYGIGLGSIGTEYYTLIRRCYGLSSEQTSCETNYNIGVRIEDSPGLTIISYHPLVTLQAGAGSGATYAAFNVNSDPYETTATITTGTGTAAGEIASVYYNADGWMGNPPAAVSIFPMNAAAAAGAPYYPTACNASGVPQSGALTSGGFVINASGVLPASTLIQIGWRVHPNITG
jgi:hypothetical protein